ncbi:MAG: hypothetical protein ACE5D2_00375 [Fidelibacterota bacterium]
MSIKDKIIFGLLAVLLITGGYFQWLSDDLKARMEVLNKQDKDHLDIIDKEFREDLRKYNLRFEGRGKHIRRAQQDIIANTNLINTTADSLYDRIDDVQWNLDEFSRVTNKKIDLTNQDLTDLQESFDSQRRLTRRKFSDLEQTVTALQNQVKELAKPKEAENGKKKKK